jgi:addiction module RelE/StbE family toxin
VKRALLRSNTFIRAARKAIKKHPQNTEDIRLALETLNTDAFHPRLKTHKLKGKLAGSWACSAGYDLRIVFKFVEDEGNESILLETIGTHEEVY